MNKGMAFYLALAVSIILLLYAGGNWRILGLVLFGVLMIWTVVEMIGQKI